MRIETDMQVPGPEFLKAIVDREGDSTDDVLFIVLLS